MPRREGIVNAVLTRSAPLESPSTLSEPSSRVTRCSSDLAGALAIANFGFQGRRTKVATPISLLLLNEMAAAMAIPTTANPATSPTVRTGANFRSHTPCDAVGGHDQLALAILLHFRFPPNDLKLSRSAEIGKAASSMGPSCRSASSGRRRSPPPPPVSNRDCLPRWSCWSRTRVRASRRRVRHGCCRSGRSPPGS